jgi:hypothetical protein
VEAVTSSVIPTLRTRGLGGEGWAAQILGHGGASMSKGQEEEQVWTLWGQCPSLKTKASALGA